MLRGNHFRRELPAVLDGGGAGTVLGLTEIAVTLDDLTIEQGSGTYAGSVNGGTLTLTNSTVSANAGPVSSTSASTRQK